MNPSPALYSPPRWLWPVMSLAAGLVMGALLTTSDGTATTPGGTAGGRKAGTEAHAPTSGRSTAAKQAPGAGGGPVSPVAHPQPLPAAVLRQMADGRSLEAAPTIWLPVQAAEIFRWQFRSADDEGLAPGVRQALGLGEEQGRQVQAAFLRFRQSLRDIERRHAEVTEKTDTVVELRIPAGLSMEAPLRQMEAELRGVVTANQMHLLRNQVSQALKSHSPAVSGWNMTVRAELGPQGKVRVVARAKGGDLTSEWPSPPPELKHLLPAIDGEGDNLHWQ